LAAFASRELDYPSQYQDLEHSYRLFRVRAENRVMILTSLRSTISANGRRSRRPWRMPKWRYLGIDDVWGSALPADHSLMW